MDNTYQNWLGEKLGERCVKAFKKHGFDAHFVSSVEEAKKLILGMVSGYESFGFAGSDTTRSLGVLEELESMGKTVFDHWQEGHREGLPRVPQDGRDRLARRPVGCRGGGVSAAPPQPRRGCRR